MSTHPGMFRSISHLPVDIHLGNKGMAISSNQSLAPDLPENKSQRISSEQTLIHYEPQTNRSLD